VKPLDIAEYFVMFWLRHYWSFHPFSAKTQFSKFIAQTFLIDAQERKFTKLVWCSHTA